MIRQLQAVVAETAQRVGAAAGRAYDTVTQRPLSLYSAAVLRIGYGSLYLVFLLREWTHRDSLWGPGSPWTPDMERRFAAQQDWYGWVKSTYTMFATDNRTLFDVIYVVSIVVCALFALGWRTRATSIGFLVVVTGFQDRSVLVADGGDNVAIIMAIYLAFTACGRRWSLDARRHRLTARQAGSTGRLARAIPADVEELRRRLVTIVHNAAMLVIAVEVCYIYAAAALFKVQGSMWRDGTAIYYALNLSWFQPWPSLSHWAAGNSTTIAVAAYLTVFVQLGMPFAVFNKRLKYTFLVIMLGMHLSIAVLMGLPLFSAAMLIGDAVFLTDSFWLGCARLVRRLRTPIDEPTPVPTPRPPGALEDAGPATRTTATGL